MFVWKTIGMKRLAPPGIREEENCLDIHDFAREMERLHAEVREGGSKARIEM